jgi:hypothetical protein
LRPPPPPKPVERPVAAAPASSAAAAAAGPLAAGSGVPNRWLASGGLLQCWLPEKVCRQRPGIKCIEVFTKNQSSFSQGKPHS